MSISSEDKDNRGLGDEPQDDWEKFDAEVEADPIDLLKPGSDHHSKVLEYLTDRIRMSERAMASFHDRWRINERKVQAYIDLPNYEQILKEQNDSGKPPQAIEINIPYTFATQSTIATYLLHTFAGRKPMFQVGSNKQETAESARNMELVLQYNADHSRLIKHLWQYTNDCQTYGVAILQVDWEVIKKMRTVWRRPQSTIPLLGSMMPKQIERFREERTVYEGNSVRCLDPFMFFPDPRVPMVDVNKSGEFVFWRTFMGKHEAMKRDYQWLDFVGQLPRSDSGEYGGSNSVRHLISGGDSQPGIDQYPAGRQRNFIQIDQGTVEIIPNELGLGDKTTPEKWLFTVGNKHQILQAEPLEADHDMHPVCVTEPFGMGHGFGNAGITDYLGDIQDTMSWFVNAHIKNVRTAVNNMFVVDPSMVEMQDLKNPRDGKLIRLKRAAYGQDVRQALQQLQVVDITRGHVDDLETFVRIGDALSSVSDNVRGLQDSGGRKTATEVRTTGEAAASRLAALARIISAQGIVDLTEMMSLNIQQNLTQDFYLSITGIDGLDAPIQISPEHLSGDFYYPIHDGTLPLDKVAMLDIWKELFLGIAQDQQLRQAYDLPKIFEWIAELGGARNIESFKRNPGEVPPVNMNVVPDEQAQQAQESGNAVGASQLVNAAPNNPGGRLSGGI